MATNDFRVSALGREPIATASGERKPSFGALAALITGSMVGSGVFSLRQSMAAGSGPLAIMIGWGVTAVGMLTLPRQNRRFYFDLHSTIAPPRPTRMLSTEYVPH